VSVERISEPEDDEAVDVIAAEAGIAEAAPEAGDATPEASDE
jgi:hypothetical protein